MDLGFKLSALRKDKNLTIKQASESVGISNFSLANYESGRRKPDLETLVNIATFYDVSVDFLLDNIKKAKENKNKKGEYEEFINIFNKKIVPIIDIVNTNTDGNYEKKKIKDITILPDDIIADYCVEAKNDIMAPTIEKGDIVAISRKKWDTTKRRIILFDLDGKKVFRYLFYETDGEIFPNPGKTTNLKLVKHIEDENPIKIEEDPKEFIKKTFVGAVTAIIKKR